MTTIDYVPYDTLSYFPGVGAVPAFYVNISQISLISSILSCHTRARLVPDSCQTRARLVPDISM